MPGNLPLVMDRAYEDNQTRQLVLDLGMVPVVPPKSNRRHPWEYDPAIYSKRNEIERLFRRLKGVSVNAPAAGVVGFLQDKVEPGSRMFRNLLWRYLLLCESFTHLR